MSADGRGATSSWSAGAATGLAVGVVRGSAVGALTGSAGGAGCSDPRTSPASRRRAGWHRRPRMRARSRRSAVRRPDGCVSGARAAGSSGDGAEVRSGGGATGFRAGASLAATEAACAVAPRRSNRRRARRSNGSASAGRPAWRRTSAAHTSALARRSVESLSARSRPPRGSTARPARRGRAAPSRVRVPCANRPGS